MRLLIVLIISMSFLSLKAQSLLPFGGTGIAQNGVFSRTNLLGDSNHLQKKWSVSKYGGLSTSWLFMNGANATVFSAPIGLQLNRRLNNNLYAFAGVAVAPTYFNFNRSFSAADANKNYLATPRFNTNGFGMSSRIEAGLMYINDDKTFSISGSIGVERNNYPFYPSNRITNQKPVLAGSRQ